MRKLLHHWLNHNYSTQRTANDLRPPQLWTLAVAPDTPLSPGPEAEGQRTLPITQRFTRRDAARTMTATSTFATAATNTTPTKATTETGANTKTATTETATTTTATKRWEKGQEVEEGGKA